MDQRHYQAAQILNGLVETTLDSALGYEQAADLARNPRFKAVFGSRVAARRKLAGELEDQVRAAGGVPSTAGTVIGPVHRAFVALRGRFSGQSDRPVVEEVERGEAFILDQFDRAARQNALPDEARGLVERALVHIRENHDEIEGLKAEFH
ncbi:MAG: ferritin-like domain-containing protein [Caulobacteraceae bacterium]